jgi:hypothetical protein
MVPGVVDLALVGCDQERVAVRVLPGMAGEVVPVARFAASAGWWVLRAASVAMPVVYGCR